MKKVLSIIFAVFCFSCSDHILLEKSEDLSARSIDKIICLSPRFYFTENRRNFDLGTVKQYNDLLQKDIMKFSKKQDFSLAILDLDGNAGIDFYNDLLSLKRNILAVNFSQANPMDYSADNGEPLQSRVFVYPPRLSHEFNSLSAKYGTKYFSYMGVYFEGHSTLMYHVLVDTDQAQTVYRELKTVHGPLNPETFHQLVYDSYGLLAEKLKK